MTTSNFTSVASNSNATNFRDWGSKLSAALTAVGAAMTADTGQINWTSVAAPGAANTSMGYEIRTLTSGVVFKIEYGSASANTLYPGTWITVGTGSDGAGNITGILFSRTQAGGNGQSTSTFNSYVCLSSSALVVAAFADFTSPMFFFSMECSRDGAGTVNSDAINVHTSSGTTSTQRFVTVSRSGSTTTKIADGAVPVSLPNSLSNAAYSATSTLSPDGVTAPFIPIPCNAPNVAPFTSIAKIAVAGGDQPAGATFTATVSGVSHAFKNLATFGSGACCIPVWASLTATPTGVAAPAMIWE